MSDLDQLIQTANKLSETLSSMADNERRFGWNLAYRLEQLSYETFKTANELKELRSLLVGGVA